MKTSVFLIEDEPDFGKILMHVLNKHPLLDVAGWAPSMAEAKSHIDQNENDVFLVDTSLPDGSGIDVMRYIKERQPQAKILALSTLGDEKHILSSLQAGASGYLLKSHTSSHLIESIVSLVNGGGYLCAHASKVLIERLINTAQVPWSSPLNPPPSPRRSPTHVAHGVTLTVKEFEVLDHAQVGTPAKKIAEKMGISIFTVNQHLRNIYHKLNARNKLEAVQSARQKGLI
jgi:DNA-binding NarL/FixJ family response regulator